MIKICYTERNNVGDSMNPYVIRTLADEEFTNTTFDKCDITGIGSGLRRFFVLPDSRKNILAIFKGRINNDPLVLWSAGFLTTPTGKEIPVRKNVKFASVRGYLSKKALEKIYKKPIDCTVGDGGLLASEILDSTVEKKYDVGIIPHDKDRDDPIVTKLKNDLPNSTVIDVRGDVIETLKAIASCRTILSSSLHGLIIADSFHIPNMHIIVSDRLSGDGFKFNDYYSGFDLTDSPIDLRDRYSIVELQPDKIVEAYRIEAEEVEKMKDEIKEAFFRFL